MPTPTTGDAASAKAARRPARRGAGAVLQRGAAIGKVVADFNAALPQATIYVYDNNSTDRTAEIARDAGAVVRRETHQGKGYVVRRMFADIDADIYVLVDGDATYDAPSAPTMIERLLEERSTWWCGARRRTRPPTGAATVFGNRLLTGFVDHVFGAAFTDILSGYRVFSRRFVKSFPVLSRRFRDRDRADRPCA